MKKSDDIHTLIDFKQERNKRIHDIHEKNLQEVNKAFEKAFPVSTKKKTKKHKGKKK